MSILYDMIFYNKKSFRLNRKTFPAAGHRPFFRRPVCRYFCDGRQFFLRLVNFFRGEGSSSETVRGCRNQVRDGSQVPRPFFRRAFRRYFCDGEEFFPRGIFSRLYI